MNQAVPTLQVSPTGIPCCGCWVKDPDLHMDRDGPPVCELLPLLAGCWKDE